MLQASEALGHANKSTKPSFAKYPTQQYHRSYRISSDECRDRPAKVNLELLSHQAVPGEPHISISQGEMVHLEQALLSSQDTELPVLAYRYFCHPHIRE